MFGWLSVEEAAAYSNHAKSLLLFSWLEFWCHSCHSCQGKIRIIAVVEVLLLLENKRMFQRFGKLTARRNKILMLTKIQVLSRAAKVNRYNFFKLSGARVLMNRYQQRKASCQIFGFCIPMHRCIQHTETFSLEIIGGWILNEFKAQLLFPS